MRLICPNCGAQYEVSDDAIPEIGRDVQCSNCGHTWFESPGASLAAEEELGAVEADKTEVTEEAFFDTPESSEPDAPDFYEETVDEETVVAEEVTEAVEQENVPETPEDNAYEVEETDDGAANEDDVEELASEDEEVGDAAQEDEEAPAAAPPARHGLEDSVADILREEADREQSARRDENRLEVQTDMPVEPTADQTAAQSQTRIARLRGDAAAENAAAVAALAATESNRKEALPDIEEISDTLRTNAERGEVVAPPPEQVEETNRKGFRWGFWGIILLILIAVVVYLFSDTIISMVPAAEASVTQYVGAVDGLRLSINGIAENAVSSLEGGDGSVTE